MPLAGNWCEGEESWHNGAQCRVVGKPARAACDKISVSVQYEDGRVADARIADLSRTHAEAKAYIMNSLKVLEAALAGLEVKLLELKKVETIPRTQLAKLEAETHTLEASVDGTIAGADQQAKSKKRELVQRLEKLLGDIEAHFQLHAKNSSARKPDKNEGTCEFVAKRATGPLAKRCATCGRHESDH